MVLTCRGIKTQTQRETKYTKNATLITYYFVQKVIDKLSTILYTISAGRDTLYTRVTEFTFKCHLMTPATGPPKGVFYVMEEL